MMRDRPQAAPFVDAVTSYKNYSGRFMWRLLRAKAAMLLGW